MRSHKSALIKASSENLKTVLIVEDDIEFCEDFTYKLTECLKDLPKDWHALHLGGTDHPNEKSKFYTINLKRCSYTTGAFAILFNSSIYNLLIDKLNNEQKLVDIYYAESMKQLNWFISTQKLVTHRQGFSEIKGKFVDYKHLR